MISMNQVWDESTAFIRRENSLLIPTALATIFIGNVVVSLAQEFSTPLNPNLPATIMGLAALIWSTIGQLAIISLVLVPRQSVRGALQHGIARIGKVIAVGVLVIIPFMVVLIPVVATAVASGVDPRNADAMRNLPPWISLFTLAAVGLFIWLTVRMSLTSALIVDRNTAVVDTLKTGFAMTRGIGARLFFVALVYAVIALVLGSAVQFVAGSIFEILGRLIGSPFAGQVATTLVVGLVSAGLSLVATVFVALLYRHATRTA